MIDAVNIVEITQIPGKSFSPNNDYRLHDI